MSSMWPNTVVTREEAFELEDAIQKLIEVSEEQKRKWQSLSLLSGGSCTAGLAAPSFSSGWNTQVAEYTRDIEHFAGLLNKAICETQKEEERKKTKEEERQRKLTL